MTDGEAFIRAIVDSPGDDTPRLVYADWLDDRDDPRGAYLRAETEWVRLRRDGERPGDSPELRDMAVGLDLVWVARVSRPPIGVCCDQLEFFRSGPELDEGAIRSMRKLRVPDEYVAFLLNRNGGIPVLRRFRVSSPRDGGWVAVDRFYSFRPAHSRPSKPQPHTVGRPYSGGNPPRRLLSIASRYDDLHGVSIVLSRDLYGRVIFDETHYYSEDDDEQYTVLDRMWCSMPAFLAELSTPCESEIALASPEEPLGAEGRIRTLADFDDSNLYSF